MHINELNEIADNNPAQSLLIKGAIRNAEQYGVEHRSFHHPLEIAIREMKDGDDREKAVTVLRAAKAGELECKRVVVEKKKSGKLNALSAVYHRGNRRWHDCLIGNRYK